MTTTAIQPWECHVPKSVSLYFVDYNESLDEHEDLQEKCIRQNSMLPLDEESSEWYSEQFSENLRTEMRDIKESMEKAGLGTDYVENEDCISVKRKAWPMAASRAMRGKARIGGSEMAPNPMAATAAKRPSSRISVTIIAANL